MAAIATTRLAFVLWVTTPLWLAYETQSSVPFREGGKSVDYPLVAQEVAYAGVENRKLILDESRITRNVLCPE